MIFKNDSVWMTISILAIFNWITFHTIDWSGISYDWGWVLKSVSIFVSIFFIYSIHTTVKRIYTNVKQK